MLCGNSSGDLLETSRKDQWSEPLPLCNQDLVTTVSLEEPVRGYKKLEMQVILRTQVQRTRSSNSLAVPDHLTFLGLQTPHWKRMMQTTPKLC